MIIPEWIKDELGGKKYEPKGAARIIDQGIRTTWEIPGLIGDMFNRDRGKGLKGGLAPRMSNVRNQDAAIRAAGAQGIGGTIQTRPHDWLSPQNFSTKETPKDIPLPGTGSRYNKDGSKRELGVGFGEPSSVGDTSASKSQEAVETRGHTLNRTGSVGGKGSVANNKEILRRMREDQLEKKVQQLQLPTEQNSEVGKGVETDITEENKDQLEDKNKSGDQRTKDENPKPEDKTPGDQADAKKSEWSKMTGSEKAQAVANIASALQKLDGSKDELIWKGTGWGGIGSGGHSGYVG